MILDNHQVVPDIIVSRDGVPNYSFAYNINTNFNNNVAPPLLVGLPESPRHFAKGRSHEVPRHAYATGNNNGSPRHAPHNGNYYSEAKTTSIGFKNEMGSFLHGKVTVKKDCSPMNSESLRESPYSENSPREGVSKSPRHRVSPFKSPLNNRYVLQSASEGMLQNLDKVQNKGESPSKSFSRKSSPVHQLHHTHSMKQGIFCSPQHFANNHLFNSKRVHPSNKGKPEMAEMNNRYGYLSRFLNETFRLRSSSHSCEGTKCISQGQSKIPVHIVRPRNLHNSADCKGKGSFQTQQITRDYNGFGSPYRNLNQKHKIIHKLTQEDSVPEVLTNDYKKICNLTTFSPKRINQRSQNHNPITTSKHFDIQSNSPRTIAHHPRSWNANRRDSLDANQWNDFSCHWNKYENQLKMDASNSWNIESDISLEENTPQQDTELPCSWARNRLASWPSSNTVKRNHSDCEDNAKVTTALPAWDEETEGQSDRDSGVETDLSIGSRMVLIKCKDASYLTRILINSEGVHGLKVVGRVGVATQGPVMSLDQPVGAPGDLNSNHSACSSDDVSRGCDVNGREGSADTTGSFISQATDTEFEHEAADYQWLLDYDMPPPRYRESYSKESLGGGRDNSSRMSVLQQGNEESHISYETLSRNIDANLAEIDMDDFRSEDIHQLLSLPNMCRDLQDGEDVYCSVSGSLINGSVFPLESSQHQYSTRCAHHRHQLRLHQQELQREYQEQQLEAEQLKKTKGAEDFEEERALPAEFDADEGEEELDEVYSGVSGDVSLYQSGPLFSPLKEPPQIPPSFSVDSLDSDSIHEDLILTCQANKNNYTIAFEGSFVQYSEESDFQEPAMSDGVGSGAWSPERLEGRSPAPNMTYSDQPYTTWSRVSRRSSQSQTPDLSQTQSTNKQGGQSPVPLLEKQPQQHHPKPCIQCSVQQHESKSNSMPNLMKRSLMRRSLETSGNCMKVYDLQNSLRSSHFSSTRSVDANNFSLMRLFIKQKSLSKEAVSLSSSCTDPSQEGGCSSSENHSAVNDSSDWPMNSQSENDMDSSASPVPVTVLNNHLVRDRLYRGRGCGSQNIMTAVNQDNVTNPTTELTNSHGNVSYEGMLNNNNLGHLNDNANSSPIDNITSFEDSLKETNPCSKPPMTSPIREEPEGMDISIDSRCENKVLLDQSEKETKPNEVLRLKDNNVDQNKQSLKARTKDPCNRTIQGNKNALNITDDNKPEFPGTPKHHVTRKENLNASQRKRQDSGNSSSGYISNKGSTERIRRSSESEKIMNGFDRPKPKPRSLKQVVDQCLQTSNLKVSATVNTSGMGDKKEVYVYYPNYALPDLGFLKDKKYSVDARIFLVPQHYMLHEVKRSRQPRTKRPFSCGDMEKLKRHGFSHVKDWESLNFLLPKELKEMLLDDTECMETIKPSFCKPKTGRRSVSCDYPHQKIPQELKESKGSSSSLTSTRPSSGYRGSSTMLNESDGYGGNLPDERYVYRYDSGSIDSEVGPPLPKRSISLTTEEPGPPDGATRTAEIPPPRPPLPRGILRKCTSLRDDPPRQVGPKRYSSGDATGAVSKLSAQEELFKRRSLQDPIETEDLQECPTKVNEKEITNRDKNAPMGCSCLSECTGFCAKGLRKKNLLLVDELPEVSSHEEFTEADLVRLRSQVSEFLAAKGGEVAGILPAHECSTNPCDCPRKSVSFAKACAHRHQTFDQTSANLSQRRKSRIPDEDLPPMLYDAHDKKTLVLSVRNAVEKLLLHFNKGTSQQDKNKLGTSLQTPEVAQLALEKLCPAIYALLSDGLLPFLHSLFGKISNSVWRVVEATSQMGPSTKALNDLVLTLNSEECLSEGPIKFNAFIFGLLNIRSLDAWLSYLRTRESALQKHYHPESFLYLSNTATRGLYDDLILALRPLALLPFRLDLLHEYKALHASLLKMEERLALHTSQSPSVAENQLDLLLVAKDSKEFRNAAARTTERNCRSPRPRSCHENSAVGLEDVQGALRKRWSGVQLGSRLVTAIDKLLTEGAAGVSSSSGDYTDSLDPPKRVCNSHIRQEDTSEDAMTDLRVSDLSSRDGDISERSATDKDTDNEKGLRIPGRNAWTRGQNESESEKFRRLQLKWEAMTGHNPQLVPKPPVGVLSPEGEGDERDKERSESLISPAGVQRSKIPRPVSITSPQQAFKPFESYREKTSPQVKQGRRPSSTLKDHPKPAPRRSLKDRVLPSDHYYHHDQSGASRGQISSSSAARARVGSRVQVVGCPTNAITSGSASSRASSVPGRKVERGSSGTRYDNTMRPVGTPRSASQGRRRGHGDESRLVQTLHHRLATDNGHLSFSRGDILTVIVEVDERFLLCCLHDRKGLVPRSSVVSYNQ